MTTNKIRRTVTPKINNVRSAAFWDTKLTPFADSGLCHCGIDERPAGFRWGDAISPTHLVFFAIRGSISFVTSRPAIKLHAGEWLAVPQGGPRYFVAGPGGAILLWFHFQPGTDWDILREHALQPSPASRSPILHAIMEALLMEYVTPGPAAREACGRLSGLMLHYLHRELIPEHSPAQRLARERLTALWTRLHGELARPWTVSQMARLANMSESQFARVVQSLYQLSPMKMLLSLRMEHAAAQLRNSSASLEAIAQDCGYASAYAFSSAFHRYFGNRPGRYRRGA